MRLYAPWSSKTDLVGTFYKTPKNHLVDLLTLSLKLQSEKRKRLLLLPKNLSQLSPFCSHANQAHTSGYSQWNTFCGACANKMPLCLSYQFMCLSTCWQWKLANERTRISALIVTPFYSCLFSNLAFEWQWGLRWPCFPAMSRNAG